MTALEFYNNNATLSMNTKLFSKFIPTIHTFDGNPEASGLQLAASGTLAVYYAPFDATNPNARVVLVGITPGRTRAINALTEARKQLLNGASHEEALCRAKQVGAFSGAMRTNLTELLDHIGLQRWLRLESCQELFGKANHLLQSGSALPFPVFVNGGNYNGSPDPISTPVLREMVLEHFVPMARALNGAVFVPLGPVPTRVLQWLVGQGHLNERLLLSGLPHPSGANSERIQYFLGKKEAARLSSKTDPVRLDAARTHLQNAIARLP